MLECWHVCVCESIGKKDEEEVEKREREKNTLEKTDANVYGNVCCYVGFELKITTNSYDKHTHT